MKKEDVKIGMKVVPHDKTSENGVSWDEWNERNNNINEFFLKNNYIYVTRFDEEDGDFVLDTNPDTYTGDFFLASDFEPHVQEEVKTQNIYPEYKTMTVIYPL